MWGSSADVLGDRTEREESSNNTWKAFITGRIVSCKNWTLNFPSNCSKKGGQNVKVFPAIIFFELLCLSVSAPLPLHFFCRYQHILTNLLIARISLWYSSRVLIKHHLSPPSFWFVKTPLPSPPRLLTKGFSVRHFSVYWTSHNYFVVRLDFLKLSGKSLAALSLKELKEQGGAEKRYEGLLFSGFTSNFLMKIIRKWLKNW